MIQGLLNNFYFAAGEGCATQTGVLPSIYKGLTCVKDASGQENLAISSLEDVFLIIGNVIQILLAVAGSIAIVVILITAALYIVSAGDPGRAKKSKDMLSNTIIGLIIILCSYAAVEFIARGF